MLPTSFITQRGILRTISKANLSTLLLMVSALLLASLLGLGAKVVNDKYYERWPLQGDTISYWARDLAIAERALREGFKSAIIQETIHNVRDPLRTLAFGMVGPNRVLSINGHLFFTGFAAWLFFWTLSLCLRERTASLLYALGAPVTAFLALGLFNPMYGAPSRLPDMPASMLLGAALFALFLSRKGQDLRWLFASGALLGLATLTRYHTWIYGAFVLGPVVTIYALSHVLEPGRLKSALNQHSLHKFLLPHFAFLGGLAIIAGLFIVWRAYDVIFFYRTAGYALNHTIAASVATTGWKLVFQYFGIPAITALLLLMAGYVALCRHEISNLDRVDFAALLWAAISAPLLVLIILRLEDDIGQTYYMIPGLTLLALSPFAISRNLGGSEWREGFGRKARPLALFAAVALPILCASAYGSFSVYVSSEAFLYPREEGQRLQKFNVETTKLIVSSLPPVQSAQTVPVVDANFGYYARYLVLEMNRRYGRLGSFGNVFQVRQSQWQLWGTGTEAESKSKIMRELTERVDVFVALAESSEPIARDVLYDDFTVRLAEYVSSEMANHPECWRARGTVQSPYGKVIVYTNLFRNSKQHGCKLEQGVIQ